jgi:hypothetical protein
VLVSALVSVSVSVLVSAPVLVSVPASLPELESPVSAVLALSTPFESVPEFVAELESAESPPDVAVQAIKKVRGASQPSDRDERRS